MIEDFYNTSFTVTRKTPSSYTGSNTVTTAGSYTGLIRPVTDVAKLFLQSNVGKEYDLVCDDGADIKVNDLIFVGSTKYQVQGVFSYEDLEDDSDSHLDIRIVKNV